MNPELQALSAPETGAELASKLLGGIFCNQTKFPSDTKIAAKENANNRPVAKRRFASYSEAGSGNCYGRFLDSRRDASGNRETYRKLESTIACSNHVENTQLAKAFKDHFWYSRRIGADLTIKDVTDFFDQQIEKKAKATQRAKTKFSLWPFTNFFFWSSSKKESSKPMSNQEAQAKVKAFSEKPPPLSPQSLQG